MSPTHWAVSLKIVRRVVVWVEVGEVDVQGRGLDAICGGRIGPLRHAGCAEQMVALCSDGGEEEQLADLPIIRLASEAVLLQSRTHRTEVVVRNILWGRSGFGHGEDRRRKEEIAQVAPAGPQYIAAMPRRGGPVPQCSAGAVLVTRFDIR